MNDEHTKELLTRFPFFGYDEWKNKPLDESVQSTLMPFGFECDDGWFTLIFNLCKFIDNVFYNHELNTKHDVVHPAIERARREDFKVIQVKEKYASLRFYYYGGDDMIEGAISFAEMMSTRICESCGDAGTVRGTGWLSTRCDSCWDKDNDDRREEA